MGNESSMKISFRCGWYCATKGNIFFFVLVSLFSRDLFLSLKLTSKGCFSKIHLGTPLFFRRVLKLCMFLLNVQCDEFVHRRRSASPSMNPFLRLVDGTNKNSYIERSLFACNAFAHRESMFARREGAKMT